jgi:hypothetical protein
LNELDSFSHVGEGIEPWRGHVPAGFQVDYLGALTRATFGPRVRPQEGHVETVMPTPENHGEGWFEWVDWVESVRAARGCYTIVSLGACFGYQLIRGHHVLKALRPEVRCKLVAVEPHEVQCGWIHQHMKDNGIDPAEHWVIQAAVGKDNDPVLFPIEVAGTGAGNCVATNDPGERQILSQAIAASQRSTEVMSSLICHNRTGPLAAVREGLPEMRFVSAVTIADIVAPFDYVDLLESDIQQSEAVVFPPAIDVLNRSVKRIHIGTHGSDTHAVLHEFFAGNGWEIIFSCLPETDYGRFRTQDGILTVRNPRLAGK